MRGGETGTGITADAIVLQEVESDASASQSTLPRFRVPVNPQRNEERFPVVAAKYVRFTTLATNENNRYEPCLDELEVFGPRDPAHNFALASQGTKVSSSGNYSDVGRHQLPHINDGKYGNERSWISNQRGGGWVQLEFHDVVDIDRVVWGRDRNGKFHDRLPTEYHIDVSTDGVTWRKVTGHVDRLPLGTPHDPVQMLLQNQLPQPPFDIPKLIDEITHLREKKADLEKPKLVYAGKFREPDETFLLKRGDPEQRGDRINPAVPVFLQRSSPQGDISEAERRAELARWITSPDNPLTARVMVNRIWQHHFGMGLVETANDFGWNGTPPSHPELLDWLANEFVRSGWSVKHIQRLIVLSSTYRQSSKIDPNAAARDRDNRFLWRYPSRRMEAEAIRDSMLAVTGELNLQMGGPGFNFFQSRGGLSGYPPVEQFGPNEFRRMIYSHKIRMEAVPVFGAFDCPDAGQSMPRRSQSTTAIQALSLFNSDFVADRAESLAKRVQESVGSDVDTQVTTTFRLALSRDPLPEERPAVTAVVQQYGLAPLGRVLFNSNEFLFIP
ncbi:MAG: hypothetical protein B7Z55_02160 [Planctomycetales bacterium 12-60-4]|nr:MAG: hypothetical protein B7Z55_02160 [Planctomycetales bacterium 12-60-4]